MSTNDLSSIPDAELRAELERRKAAKKAEEKKWKKEHTVTIVCPMCDGNGVTQFWNMDVAVGASSGVRECELCKGSRYIAALKR